MDQALAAESAASPAERREEEEWQCCAICMCDFDEDNPRASQADTRRHGIVFKCDHAAMFHLSCLQLEATQDRPFQCPLCRAKFGFSVRCICGARLERRRSNDRSLYGGGGVLCDHCCTDIPSNMRVYHCPAGKSADHPDGYDVCFACTGRRVRRSTSRKRRSQSSSAAVANAVQRSVSTPSRPVALEATAAADSGVSRTLPDDARNARSSLSSTASDSEASQRVPDDTRHARSSLPSATADTDASRRLPNDTRNARSSLSSASIAPTRVAQVITSVVSAAQAVRPNRGDSYSRRSESVGHTQVFRGGLSSLSSVGSGQIHAPGQPWPPQISRDRRAVSRQVLDGTNTATGVWEGRSASRRPSMQNLHVRRWLSSMSGSQSHGNR